MHGTFKVREPERISWLRRSQQAFVAIVRRGRLEVAVIAVLIAGAYINAAGQLFTL